MTRLAPPLKDAHRIRRRPRVRSPMEKMPEYNSWRGMIDRCYNPHHNGYHNYGGRGIAVCDRWRSFADFYADMGPRPSPKHTLDRYPNNDGDYEPGNCRWATRIEQAQNQRTNRVVSAFGKTQCASAWAREYEMPLYTFIGRLNLGMSPEQALTAPKRRKELTPEIVARLRQLRAEGATPWALGKSFRMDSRRIKAILSGEITA